MNGFIEVETVEGMKMTIGTEYIEEFKPNTFMIQKFGNCQIFHSGSWTHVINYYENIRKQIKESNANA